MPVPKTARAEVRPRRQRTQYSCMACSMAMCLTANGVDADEDTVNEVMGAQPMRGAAWEQALACAQHYGMRATLTVPATLSQVKALTDKGVPVMIAWNPEGREWSHASVVVDVVPCETHGFMVHVADPNIPDPEQTVRVVTKDEFYKKWYEKWPNYLVRRPAMAVEREITPDGRQVMASTRTAAYKGIYTRERQREINQGSVSREEAQEAWAERQRYERSGQRQIDETVHWVDEARRRLLRPWDGVVAWFRQYGNAYQRDLAAWRDGVTLGRARSMEEATRYRDEFRTLQDIYDHPSGKGREFFNEVQRVLNLPTPLTPPPPGAERNLGGTEDAELRDKWERVVAYYSDLKGVAGNLERLLEAKLKRAIQDMPADLQGIAAGMNPNVNVDATEYGRPSTLGMAISQVGGYPEDIPDNLYTVVGYPLRCSITVGISHRGGWEAHMVFGVFPHLEESPKPRLLSAWVRYGRNKKDLTEDLVNWGARTLYPWPIAGAAAVRGNEKSTSESLTRANYEKAKTLTQSTGVIDAMFDSLQDEFAASAAAWVAEQEHEVRRREELRQAEDARRQREAEEALRQKEEAARRQREKEEARRQREMERSQAKTVVDSALAEKFAILDQLIAGGFPQARDIAREVKSVYEAGGKPTEDQLKALRNMMYRSRMKAEADHFRVASSGLEAAWWGDDAVAHTAKVKDTVKIKKEDLPKHRHGPEFVQNVMRRPGGGTHHTRTKDVEEGSSRKEKHRKNWADREADELTAAWGDT